MMATAYATSYSVGCYPHLEQPLKWILSSVSNSFKCSDDSSTLGLLLDRKDPIKNMTNPMTRTNFKQQLQRQQLEQQDQLFHSQKLAQPDQPHSQSIAVPRTSSPTTLPPDVPSSVLQVRRLNNKSLSCSFGKMEYIYKELLGLCNWVKVS